MILGLRLWALSRTGRISDALVERLGKRRAAAIVLNEGGLLALRLPSNARFLLQQARTWFVEVRDFRLALIASLCHALACLRLNSASEA